MRLNEVLLSLSSADLSIIVAPHKVKKRRYLLRSCFVDVRRMLLFMVEWVFLGASLVAQLVKNLPAMQEILVRFLGQEDPQEKG